MKKLFNTSAAILASAVIFSPLFLSMLEVKIIPLDTLTPFTDCAAIEEADFGSLGKVRGCVGWSFQITGSKPYIIIVRTVRPR